MTPPSRPSLATRFAGWLREAQPAIIEAFTLLAPYAAAAMPAAPRQRKPRAKVAPDYNLEELAQWVADNCARMDNPTMAHYLSETYNAQGKDIAVLLDVNAGTISRWLNGNGVKAQ